LQGARISGVPSFCPICEEMLAALGIYRVKVLSFSGDDEEQERRLQEAHRKSHKNRWDSYSRWTWNSQALGGVVPEPRDVMLRTPTARKTQWSVLTPDDKKRGPINCIAILLDQIPYQD